MGDIRYERLYRRIAEADDRAAAIQALDDEEVIQALAAARRDDPYLTNVLASEAMNRVRRKGTIVNIAAEGLISQDAEGRLTFMNPAAERLLGWTFEELRGKDVHDMIHAHDEEGNPLPRDACAAWRVLRTKERVLGVETVLTRKDGTKFPAEQNTAPILQDGEVTGVVVTFFDITERKRRERYRAASHAVTEVLASAATIEEAAPKILEALGKGFEWHTGTLWILHKDDVLRPLAFWKAPGVEAPNLEAVTRTLSFRRGEGIPGRVLQDGKPRWDPDFLRLDPARYPRVPAAIKDGVHATFAFPCPTFRETIAIADFFSREIRPPDPDLLEAIETLGSDIGQFIDRKRAEAALRESEARKAGILRASLDAIITINHESRIIEWNPAAERIFGYAASEVLGKDMASIIIPERYREAHRRGLAHYLAAGEGPILGQRLELPALRRDGSEFPAELAIVPISTSPPFFTGYLRDLKDPERTRVV